MRLREVFKRNLELVMKFRGISYFDLYKLTNGDISVGYLSKIRNDDEINPTLNKIDTLAKALSVNSLDLLNPNLDLENLDLPDGYVRVSYVLSYPRSIAVRGWEQIALDQIRYKRQIKKKI